jgi:hypothetical protein
VSAEEPALFDEVETGSQNLWEQILSSHDFQKANKLSNEV